MDYCIRENHAAKSVYKYLSSTGDFLSFLQMDKIKLVGTTADETYNKLLEKIVQISSKQKLLVETDDFDHFNISRTSEDSSPSEKARELFKEFSEKACAVSCNGFWSMRDHLFVCIHFGNRDRSGVSANMMLKEFKGAQQQGGNYIIHVMKHKTIKTSGPALVTLTTTQFKWLEIYVKKIRAQVKPKVDNVFLSRSGLALDPGQRSR